MIQITIAYLVFVLHSLLFRNWLIDDAGISFAYARNLIHGYGLVSQPAVPPVEGFSNPLWTFLIAPFFIKPPFDPTFLFKGFSLLLVLFTMIILNKIVTLFFNDEKWARGVSFFILLALSVNSSVVIWSTSGLENVLQLLLCSGYLLTCVSYCRESHEKYCFRSGLIAAALALNRPEGILYTLVFPFVLILQLFQGKDRSKILRHFGMFFAASLIPVAAYQLFRMKYFGDPYPNAFYVKGGPIIQGVLQKCLELINSMIPVGGILLLVLLVIFAATGVRTKDRPGSVALIFMLLCSMAAYSLLPEDWMREYRFGTAFFVMFYTSFFILAGGSISRMTGLQPFLRNACFVVLGIVLISVSAKDYVSRSFTYARTPTAPFSEVARINAFSFNDYAKTLGLQNSALLTPDVGATLYYSSLRVYDVTGLCDRNFARFAGEGRENLRNYVFEELRPSFIHLHGSWSIYTGLQLDARFRNSYFPIEELPFVAFRNGEQVRYYHGDYVRKDLVSSQAQLDNLRKRATMGPSIVQ